MNKQRRGPDNTLRPQPAQPVPVAATIARSSVSNKKPSNKK